MKKKLIYCITSLLFCCSLALAQTAEPAMPASAAEVAAIIKKANHYWQTANPNHGRAFWDNAAYHTGNMEAYKVTGTEAYKSYSEAWAGHNQWKGAKSDDKAGWKYSYGESDEYVLFGDYQIAFQTYIDLYNLDEVKDPKKIARAREVMEYQMSTSQNDYWWWADGLYMVMPVMTKLYHVTGNKQYLEKLYEYLSYANSIMYDEEEKLYYRDAKYVYPKHKSANSKKDFWARGDGWVFAGLAKVLQDLPTNDPHRNEYIEKFVGMAEAIKNSQQPEGYWTRSMLDPEHAPGPESSGTSFFTYGLLWGINNGFLGRDEYLPAALRGYKFLTEVALQPNGRVGYVQPIGERAIPGQVVDANSTANFGVGAFLLATSEMHRMVEQERVRLNESDLARNISAYPNVANSEVRVQLPAGLTCKSVLVKDETGKQVAKYKGKFTGEKVLPVKKLTKAPYALELKTSKGTITKTMLVQ
ncbi:glycoside hydrolase family 88 protein [Pontibacter qinzhouensis]|uniref:Glycoside hydrolase family 88 protein n=1 Tax=Pontibacter qinzhouensis TaxID=2603253 RepID=A0A5C8JIU6_9BACT|nr:glycoside hydrolase family 88 protein [Pontibacter qinzhouensis]TXK36487.1 glycoside hydrolase family 88 protein [Pontibacter qinzhouensis]